MGILGIDVGARSGTVARRRWLWIAAVTGLAAACAHAQVPAALDARRVVIDSSWAGLNPEAPFRTRIVLERDGSAYRLTGGHSKGHYSTPQAEEAFPSQMIPAEKVEHLVAAMRAQAQTQVDLDMLQPVVGGVQDRIDQLLGEADMPTSPPSLLEKIHAWRDSLRSPQVLVQVLTKGFGATHTDDGPSIKVEAVLFNGTTLSARSSSQQFLMLPWANAEGALTYASALPLAVDALLPNESTNKKRLEGSLGESDLDEMLGFGLQVDKERFDVEAQAPGALRLLDARFKVLEVSLASWDGRHLDADLQLPDGPRNLVLSTRLALTGPSLANVRDIDRITQQLALAQSSPALAARMKANAGSDFRIEDASGWAWLNDRTASQFVKQMQSMQKLPELKTNPALMHDAVMVVEEGKPIYWIVLSDRRAVRWKEYSSEPGPLGGTPCEAIPSANDKLGVSNMLDTCIGEVYGTDGRVQ